MKFIAISILVIVLAIAIVCIAVPSNIVASKTEIVQCNPDAAYRFIAHFNNLQKVCNEDAAVASNNTNQFTCNGHRYTVVKRLHTALAIKIESNEAYLSQLMVFPLNKDSAAVTWSLEMNGGFNPVTRVSNYFKAVALKDELSQLLTKLKKYLAVEENVYGRRIIRTNLRDTLFAATKTALAGQPATSDIYALVERLQRTLASQQITQTGVPIVNVTDNGDHYQLMVAVPTSKRITETGSVFFRYMVPGYFLTTKVIGGPETIANAAKTVQQYILDKRKISMAIPFNALITDRSKVSDTAAWVTQMYFPIAF